MGINETFARTDMHDVKVTLSPDQALQLAAVLPGFSPEKHNVNVLLDAHLNDFCDRRTLLGRLEIRGLAYLQNGGMDILAQMSDGLVQSMRGRFQISGEAGNMPEKAFGALLDRFIENGSDPQPSSDASSEIKPYTPPAPFTGF